MRQGGVRRRGYCKVDDGHCPHPIYMGSGDGAYSGRPAEDGATNVADVDIGLLNLIADVQTISCHTSLASRMANWLDRTERLRGDISSR